MHKGNSYIQLSTSNIQCSFNVQHSFNNPAILLRWRLISLLPRLISLLPRRWVDCQQVWGAAWELAPPSVQVRHCLSSQAEGIRSYWGYGSSLKILLLQQAVCKTKNIFLLGVQANEQNALWLEEKNVIYKYKNPRFKPGSQSRVSKIQHYVYKSALHSNIKQRMTTNQPAIKSSWQHS